MKKTLLWGALFTLMSTQASADPEQPVTTPAPQQESAPVTTLPAVTPEPQPAPVSQTQPAPAATPVIDCDYKIPADTKSVDQSLVVTWSEKAVVQAFSFDSMALDAQMQKLQNCFTEQGWTGFNTALQKSGNIEAIKSQKLTVTSKIDGQPLVLEAKDSQWKLTLPVVVTYQNDKEKVNQLLSVDLIVSRKPSGDLGIIQMIAAPRGTVSTTKPAEEVANPEQTSLDTKPADKPADPTTPAPATPQAPADTHQ